MGFFDMSWNNLDALGGKQGNIKNEMLKSAKL